MALNLSSSLVALCFLSFFFLSSYVNAFNITAMLDQYPDFSNFNNYLTQTQGAAAVNSRNTITVLAVENGHMSSLDGQSADFVKKVMSVHVILDYYDVQKLQQLSSKTALLTTLYQASGSAQGQEGFLNVTVLDTSTVAFGSAVPGSPLNSNLIKAITSQPYNISVLQVSNLIVPGAGGSSGSSNSSTNSTSPSSSPSAPSSSPVSPSSSPTPPSSSPTTSPASAANPKSAPTPATSPPTASKAPTPSTAVPPTSGGATAPTSGSTPPTATPSPAHAATPKASPTPHGAPTPTAHTPAAATPASDSPVASPPSPLGPAPVADGPAADGPAADGPAADGPAADEPKNSGAPANDGIGISLFLMASFSVYLALAWII